MNANVFKLFRQSFRFLGRGFKEAKRKSGPTLHFGQNRGRNVSPGRHTVHLAGKLVRSLVEGVQLAL